MGFEKVEQMFNNFSNVVVQCFNDVKNGTCINNFKGMSDELKIKTVLKVAAAAVAAGLLVGLLAGSGIVGTLIAATVGIGAFVYLTSSGQHGFVEKGQDFVNSRVDAVRNDLHEGVNGFMNAANDLKEKFQ